MRKAMILMTVAALMLALMAGTAAAKQNGKNRATYNFKGTLEAVAEDGSYVVVDVTDGNKRAQQHLGEQHFGASSATKVEVNEESVELSALAEMVGEQVKVQSKAAKNAQTFDARKVSMEVEAEEESTQTGEESAPAL